MFFFDGGAKHRCIWVFNCLKTGYCKMFIFTMLWSRNEAIQVIKPLSIW